MLLQLLALCDSLPGLLHQSRMGLVEFGEMPQGLLVLLQADQSLPNEIGCFGFGGVRGVLVERILGVLDGLSVSLQLQTTKRQVEMNRISSLANLFLNQRGGRGGEPDILPILLRELKAHLCSLEVAVGKGSLVESHGVSVVLVAEEVIGSLAHVGRLTQPNLEDGGRGRREHLFHRWRPLRCHGLRHFQNLHTSFSTYL